MKPCCKPQFHVTALLFLLLLTGCAGLKPAGETGIPVADRAAARAAHGDWQAAAQLYAQAAKEALPAGRNRLWLASGEAAARAGDAKTAGELLDRVDPEALDAKQRARLKLARTEAQLIGLPPAEALARLPEPKGDMPPEVASRLWLLRAGYLFDLGRTVAGVHALVQRDVWLLEPEAVQANDERIWNTLRNRPPQERDPENLANLGDTTRGWVALARAAAKTTDPSAREDALIAWERRYPGHPATRYILPERLGYSPIVPDSFHFGLREGHGLALALPFTGRFAEPAAAIRDGFLSAYYAGDNPRPRLRLYDTNALPDMAALLARARADGVGVLVGPLQKERVAELAELDLPMPVLALNYMAAETDFPGFYQFGLAPEDEAASVAEQAVQQGLPRALALVPDNDWGSRVLTAFRNSLDNTGGTLVDYATFDPGKQDHAAPIKTLLQYRGVSARQERRRSPNVERGRRQDADFIFVAAQPAHARLIRTQLRFFRASRLPVLATSHVYTGFPDPRSDQDLDGLMFADMPWILSDASTHQRDRIARLWPDAARRFPRLFALGIDAWRVQAHLGSQPATAGPLFAGATGRLYLRPDGRILRELEWAHFVNGRPVPLPKPLPQAVP